jgi:hypothetical protein
VASVFKKFCRKNCVFKNSSLFLTPSQILPCDAKLQIHGNDESRNPQILHVMQKKYKSFTFRLPPARERGYYWARGGLL